MIEQRRIRFSSLESLLREDLRLAGEVWLDDIIRAPWATRESMKIAAHLVRYMFDPKSIYATVRGIERELLLPREEIERALTLMRIFHVVDEFVIDRDEIRIALNLADLQRLRVLEVKERLTVFAEREHRAVAADAQREEPARRWSPEHPLQHRAPDGGEDNEASIVSMLADQLRRAIAKLESEHAVRAA
ncbi:MAG: hypothetical protein ACT4N2_06220 [Hyphomicrobium sp.]